MRNARILPLALGALLALAARAGAETIDLANPGAGGTGWHFADPVLTLTGGDHALISTAGVTSHRVVIDGDVGLTVRGGLRIDAPAGGAPLALDAGATLRLTLAAGCRFQLVGGVGFAGLEVPDGAALTVDGAGALSATGGDGGAGLGGSAGQDGGAISLLGGNVTARGGGTAPAVGGGTGGAAARLLLDGLDATLRSAGGGFRVTAQAGVSGLPVLPVLRHIDGIFPSGTPSAIFRNGTVSDADGVYDPDNGPSPGRAFGGTWRAGFWNARRTHYPYIATFGTHVLGSDQALEGRVDGPFPKFQDGLLPWVGVSVNGRLLPPGSAYQWRAGSTVLTLTPAYLNALAVGEYPITVHFVDGDAPTTFRVVAGEDAVPPTGDRGGIGAYLALLCVALAMLLLCRRRAASAK